MRGATSTTCSLARTDARDDAVPAHVVALRRGAPLHDALEAALRESVTAQPPAYADVPARPR
jgi:hypothetical protein